MKTAITCNSHLVFVFLSKNIVAVKSKLSTLRLKFLFPIIKNIFAQFSRTSKSEKVGRTVGNGEIKPLNVMFTAIICLLFSNLKQKYTCSDCEGQTSDKQNMKVSTLAE